MHLISNNSIELSIIVCVVTSTTHMDELVYIFLS